PEEMERRRAQAVTATLLHLDQAVDGDDSTLGDRVQEPSMEVMPETALELRELRGTLARAVQNLPAVQATVVSRYYVDGNLLHDIAADLGLTEARVSQIRSEALATLKAFFATQYEEVANGPENAPGKRARVAYLERMEQ